MSLLMNIICNLQNLDSAQMIDVHFLEGFVIKQSRKGFPQLRVNI